VTRTARPIALRALAPHWQHLRPRCCRSRRSSSRTTAVPTVLGIVAGTMFAVSNLAGTAADWMIRRGTSVTTTRKIMHCGALIVSAGLLLALHGVHSPTAALTMRDVGRPTETGGRYLEFVASIVK
jgi:hypothetical protein